MFGRSKPVVFDPYRGRRKRSGPPAWMWWLTAGLALGAIGVVVAQQRWLPPRLSATESAQLRESYAQADADRSRLQADLTGARRQLEQAGAERDSARQERDALASRVASFDRDLAFVVEALPPDPRSGTVAVRAARLATHQGSLQYALALSHGRPGGRPITAVLRLAVTGTTSSGSETQVDLQPVDLTLAPQHVASGQVPLPAGFTPRQATVRVVDGNGATLGLRVLIVR